MAVAFQSAPNHEEHRSDIHREMARTELSEIIELAPAFMVGFRGPNFIIEMANDAYRQLSGLPVRQAFPEIEGQGFFEYATPCTSCGWARLSARPRCRCSR